MIHNTWLKEKPVFTEECILLTASNPVRDVWDYNSWMIIATVGFNEEGNSAWYYAICEMDGEEWGNWVDFKSDKYFTTPLLK